MAHTMNIHTITTKTSFCGYHDYVAGEKRKQNVLWLLIAWFVFHAPMWHIFRVDILSWMLPFLRESCLFIIVWPL